VLQEEVREEQGLAGCTSRMLDQCEIDFREDVVQPCRRWWQRLLAGKVPAGDTRHWQWAVIDKGIQKMGGPLALENGVCLHHRDGQDWHEHCKSWENIPDGQWRKNWLEQDGKEIGQLVKDRLLEEDANGTTITTRLLYYVGDHDPPTQHLSTYGFKVISRADTIGES